MPALPGRYISKFGFFATVLIGSAVVVSPTVDARGGSGKIVCDGPWQKVRGGGKISTPYCSDKYLAKVARTHGIRTSARKIRASTTKKAEICNLIAHNPRVTTICGSTIFED